MLVLAYFMFGWLAYGCLGTRTLMPPMFLTVYCLAYLVSVLRTWRLCHWDIILFKLCFLCGKRGTGLKKSTLPPVVAVVTNIRYDFLVLFFAFFHAKVVSGNIIVEPLHCQNSL